MRTVSTFQLSQHGRGWSDGNVPRWLVWLAGGMALTGLLGRTLAQPDPFNERIAEAGRHHAANRPREALRAFEAAYALRPLPAVALNIGRLQLQLGSPREALRYCQEYLTNKKAPPADRKREAESCVAQAQKQLLPPPSEERPRRRPVKKQDVTVPAVAPVAAAPACKGPVRIPAGTFQMGSNDGGADEKPVHEVKVVAFKMDCTEVTVEEYGRCVKAGTCQAQDTVNGGYSEADKKLWNEACNWGKAGKDSHPMNCVDWAQASAYCAFAGGRLPTEEEWEYATRGTDGRKYPWGSQAPGPTRLNACGPECLAWGKERGRTFSTMYSEPDGWPTTAPVGSYPAGRSPFGLLDMAGNVWEWTASNYCDANSKKCADTAGRVVRGGSWDSGPSLVRAANRDESMPSGRYGHLGFRCAWNVP